MRGWVDELVGLDTSEIIWPRTSFIQVGGVSMEKSGSFINCTPYPVDDATLANSAVVLVVLSVCTRLAVC